MTDVRPAFDAQVAALVAAGYPALAGLDEAELVKRLDPLGDLVVDRVPPVALEGDDPGRLPFVLVVGSARVPPRTAVEAVRWKSTTGWTDLPAEELETFVPIEGLEVPGLDATPAYVLLDVDTGRETMDVTPNDALVTISGQGRSPLTIGEGVAVLTQWPGILRSANAFSLLGSRCGDKRVPALWVSYGRPRLGWCWAGNPHTWLGSASCAGRLAV